VAQIAGSRRGRWLVTVVALGIVSALGACSAAPTDGSNTATLDTVGIQDASSPTDGGQLVVGIQQETSGWNPRVNQWAQVGATVGSTVIEPLASLASDGTPQPWLATGWTSSDDDRVWTITLRDGVTFHDGSAFDAAAVKKNIDYVGTGPQSGIVYGALLKDVSVIDPHTVKVELTQKWSAFPTSFLAGQAGFILAPAMIDAPDAGQAHPIGTGPFQFDEWKTDQYFRVKKNPNYWRKGEPHLEKIEFRVLVDGGAMVNGLKAGDIDMFFGSDAQAAGQLASSYKEIKNWATQPAMLITNTLSTIGGQANPLANKHARLALAHATDRHALAAIVGDGVLTPTSPFGPDSPWGQAEDQNGYPEFDVSKAKDEVDAYKKETGASGLTVAVSANLDNLSSQVLQVLQSQWKAAGIDATLENTEATAFIGEVIGGNYQLALFPIYTASDPDEYWYFWSSTTAKGPGQISINFSQFSSPAIDADLAKGRESSDPGVRKSAYSSLVQELNANAVNIWLYSIPNTLIASSRVNGLAEVAKTPFATYEPKTWFGQLWMGA